MLRTTKLIGTATLGLVLGVVACHNDELFRPTTIQPVNVLFTRYVSMGNSITAGFQSAGINDSTQLQSYANLLAGRMQTPFFMPLMNRPGCPPPLINVFTNKLVPPAVPNNCALRKTQPLPPPYINDVAVPGAAVEDLLSNLSPGARPNGLTTFFLGGLTQNQAMLKVNPTFITVWIGNNDVLGAATDTANGGNPAEVTSIAIFSASYDSVLDAIDHTPASGNGVLIGVADVATIPYFSYGHIYFGAKLAGKLPTLMTVALNCAPQTSGGVGDTTLVPFRYGATLLATANAGFADTLDCANDHNITPSELANLHASVAGYNAHISGEATARGYAYFNPNIALGQLRADTSQVVIFPHFPVPATDTSAGVQQRPFGFAFSRDGVHPSQATHKLIANALIAAINTKYNTTLVAIP
jgi:lysophospholipase L1-like esterase